MASLRGYYLRMWRYGAETEKYVQEALERESWSSERWDNWQRERLAFVLHRAATRVPYYRNMWRRRRVAGDKRSHEYLENWPVLEKECVRNNPRSFVADDCDTRWMFREHTSGTTGKPLSLWWSLETVRKWYALFEARCRRWYGVSLHDRWAIIGGQLVTSVDKRDPPFWVWNWAMNQLYMSSYHLAPDLIDHYLRALDDYRIHFLFGYSSSLYELAQGVLKSGKCLTPRVVVTNAEPLYDYQRDVISRAFRCPVRQTYGMAEIVATASECMCGRMHLWPDLGMVEVCNGEENVEDERSGDLVCTGLLNSDMPLIRYRIGDSGTLSESGDVCGCGRRMPILKSVEGRSDDLIYTVDGKRVGRLDPVFKGELPIKNAQIIQDSFDSIRVLLVPSSGYSENVGRLISQRLQERVGPAKIIIERVHEIQRQSNGKYKGVINNMRVASHRSGEKCDHELQK
ncbi:MAG: phenylacetate--CoA ligase family protein [Deltaproteobacteria bacterium]|nr:phenylacetate--CoA ligase family protein [Deltaproteobacteria bacterium]